MLFKIFDDYYVEGNIFPGLLIGFIFGIIVPIILPTESILVKTSSNKIECLQDNNNVSGSFFVGCGSVNNSMKYTYYYDCGDSTFVMAQLDVENVKIKYTNERPYVEKFEYKKTDKWINSFSFELRRPKYIIHIPKGSIMNNYNLDAK